MVTVPNFCPDATALPKNPVFLYLMDDFQKPYPFQPDVVVDVGDVMTVKWDMLDAMDSQFYEWLPWLDGKLDDVPKDPAARRAWMERTWDDFFRQPANKAREALTRWYGPAGGQVEYAELFEICEYGHQPSPEELRRLFPFFPLTAEET
jgi:LmbE family N-acetylglucosaminyl deacetylase